MREETVMKFSPTLEEVKKIAQTGQYKVLPVSCEILSDICTPMEALKVLKNVSTHCYMLESVAEKEKWGRYTFLGFDPKMEITCSNGEMKAGNITADELMHGKQSRVRLDPDCPLFQNCPETAPVARYHSLIAKADTLPDCLRVTAVTEKGEVMAVQHTQYPIYGMQFHPESIMTPDGKTMLMNFIKIGETERRRSHD